MYAYMHACRAHLQNTTDHTTSHHTTPSHALDSNSTSGVSLQRTIPKCSMMGPGSYDLPVLSFDTTVRPRAHRYRAVVLTCYHICPSGLPSSHRRLRRMAFLLSLSLSLHTRAGLIFVQQLLHACKLGQVSSMIGQVCPFPPPPPPSFSPIMAFGPMRKVLVDCPSWLMWSPTSRLLRMDLRGFGRTCLVGGGGRDDGEDQQ